MLVEGAKLAVVPRNASMLELVSFRIIVKKAQIR